MRWTAGGSSRSLDLVLALVVVLVSMGWTRSTPAGALTLEKRSTEREMLATVVRLPAMDFSGGSTEAVGEVSAGQPPTSFALLRLDHRGWASGLVGGVYGDSVTWSALVASPGSTSRLPAGNYVAIVASDGPSALTIALPGLTSVERRVVRDRVHGTFAFGKESAGSAAGANSTGLLEIASGSLAFHHASYEVRGPAVSSVGVCFRSDGSPALSAWRDADSLRCQVEWPAPLIVLAEREHVVESLASYPEVAGGSYLFGVSLTGVHGDVGARSSAMAISRDVLVDRWGQGGRGIPVGPTADDASRRRGPADGPRS